MADAATLSAPDLSESVEALRSAGADFHRRGWSLGTSSNYSVIANRRPLELLVTVSGKDKGRLGPNDFVSVGADGRPLDPAAPASSAETLLHVAIAELLPAVGSVLHTHSVFATLLSDHCREAGGVTIEGYEMLKGLEGIATHRTRACLPIFDNTQDIPDLADEVRAWLGESAEDASPGPHAFLIHKHGLYTWGPTVAAARRQVEILEFLFECEWRRLAAAC